MANDEEYARAIAEQEDLNVEWHPRLTQWDLNTSLLAEIRAALGGVQDAIIASNGGKPTTRKPFPRPITKIDEAREQVQKDATSAILSMAGFDPSEYL